MALEKIVSGGQTGVDRAALDAALDCDFPCGGWCPKGRRAEDGRIPDRYPLAERVHGGYPGRTKANVVDSDGTLVISFGKPAGGTAKTIAFCVEHARPYVLVDAARVSPEQAAQLAAAFVVDHDVRTLNVAGPRASGEKNAYSFALETITLLLRRVVSADPRSERSCRLR